MMTKKVSKKSSKSKNTKKEEKTTINPRNYLYALLILVGGILLALYISKWYAVKKEEKLMTSYLITSNTIQNSNDLNSFSQLIQEMPSSYFVYISYTGNEEVYNLEKNLKMVIDKYNLNDIFYYVDVTNLTGKENYLEEIKSSLKLPRLKNVPAIIYVDEGKVLESNILDGIKDTNFKINDLEDLLSVYDYEVIK